MDYSAFGTHGDGHPNSEYCIDCYRNGMFAYQTEEDQISAIASSGKAVDISTLKRWLPVQEQASWILDHCGYVTLATIEGQGFPRPVAIDVIDHDGISTLWMTTYRNSHKAMHIKANPKAGISAVYEADSITLIGMASVIADRDILNAMWQDRFIHYFPNGPEDENYSLIRFDTANAVLWIDGKLTRFGEQHD